MASFLSLNKYLYNKYGCKVYKLALNGGMTCPNRDGKISTGGCIFCSAGGSGDFATPLISPANKTHPLASQQPSLLNNDTQLISVSSQQPNLLNNKPQLISACSQQPNLLNNEPQLISVSSQQPNKLKKSVRTQISQAKNLVKNKLKNQHDTCKYIAYFQAYTNTYAPVSYLRELFMAAISEPDIVILSIATRPDCIPDDVLDLLIELNQIKPVWIELGLQTIHEATAKFINRGYPLSTYENCIKRLNNAGIEVITHLIFGLPNESKEMMLDSVRYLASTNIQGVKLQLLHILKNTSLGEDYLKNPQKYSDPNIYAIQSLDEYVDIILEALSILPNNMVIHRLTGDAKRSELLFPDWSTDKRRILNSINNHI